MILNKDKSLRIRYNVADLPLYIKQEALSDFQGKETLSHWNDELETIYMKKGSMHIFINGQHILLKEREICVIDANCVHHFSSIDDQDAVYYVGLLEESLFTSAEFLKKRYIGPLFHSFHPNYAIIPADSPYNEVMHQIFLTVLDLNNKRPEAYDLLIISKIHEYAALLWIALKDEFFLTYSADNKDTALLRNMILYIQENYAKKIIIKDLLQIDGISRRKCFALFSKYIGKTPANYILDFRLDVGRGLLRNGNMTIAEIAITCGFAHQSHFTKQFYNRYHMTPNTFRKSREGIDDETIYE